VSISKSFDGFSLSTIYIKFLFSLFNFTNSELILWMATKVKSWMLVFSYQWTIIDIKHRHWHSFVKKCWKRLLFSCALINGNKTDTGRQSFVWTQFWDQFFSILSKHWKFLYSPQKGITTFFFCRKRLFLSFECSFQSF
jgi:hypothetical protein